MNLTEFEFTDHAGDELTVNPGVDVVVICTSDAVAMPREDVRRLVVWLHQWLGDIEVTSLDQSPGSAWLPGPNSGTP